MNKKFKFKYPKFLLLFLTILLAYFIFKERNFIPIHDFFVSVGHFGSFLTGILFAYGFTAAPATAILFILAKEQNIILTGLIAGLGTVLADFIIFKLIKNSFSDEVEKLSEEKIIKKVFNFLPKVFKKYLLPVAASLIILSPLPDEIGICLLVASKRISFGKFAVISYVLNVIGIFLVLLIGKNI
ncbi:MAG: hypothetical protein PHF44_04655 [Candidatus Pacebacteria bacterium]|nr:hypothetical protein [Candidatus Paceibacterota bacterium]